MKDKLNKKDIINLLPHREPMLLIDELINIKNLKSATAIMNVKKDSFYVDGHFPGQPVMPGVLIVEAMAQASGILGFKTMDKKPEDGSIYYFVGADDLRFKRPAIPGDQLILNSKVLTNKKGIWKFECYATVEEDIVAKATILCADRPK